MGISGHFGIDTLRPKCADFLASNMYTGNIEAFCHRKLCMKA